MMDEAEFDKFADEYSGLHRDVIGASGESTAFFAEYKVKDTVQLIDKYAFPADISIMDFGSGVGSSVPYFLKHLPSSQLTCLDVSQKSLDICISRFDGKANFVHFDGKTIPLEDNSFNVVFAACVFHHISPDSHKLLSKEILRVLKPSGIFIAFEHNPYNFLTVRAVNACSLDENAILLYGKGFRGLLRKSGFCNDKLVYRIFFPGSLRKLRPLERFMRWIPFGAQYYVSAQKPT